MAEDNNRLRIFIASPGDVAEERDIVSYVVGELRRMFEDLLPYRIDAVRWETHTWPDVGEGDSQDVINREIGEYDIFVGVMWRRFGTPTNRAGSGTEEEFDDAYNCHKEYGRPRIMFYFRETPFYSTDREELRQFEQVLGFREKLEEADVYYWKYEDTLVFERTIREHLIRQILSIVQGDGPSSDGTATKRGPSIHGGEPRVVEAWGKTSLPAMGASGTASSVRTVTSESLTTHGPEDEGNAAGSRSVFVSYSHADKDRASEICSHLRAAGFDPWFAADKLLPGEDWRKAVDEAIEDSAFFLLCASPKSLDGPNYMNMEVGRAIERMRRLTPDRPYFFYVALGPGPCPVDTGKVRVIDYYLPDGSLLLVRALREALDQTTSP